MEIYYIVFFCMINNKSHNTEMRITLKIAQ